jgi:hypothetical protein
VIPQSNTPAQIIELPPIAPPTPLPVPPKPVQVKPLEIEFSEPSATPGGSLEVSGSGCTSGSTVTVEVDGAQVATSTAAADGTFDLTVDLPDLAIGRSTATVVCGAISTSKTFDVVRTATTNPAQSQSVIVIIVFGVVSFGLLQAGPTPVVARRRRLGK